MVKVNQIKDADSWEKELASVLEVYSKKMEYVHHFVLCSAAFL